jgi:hypothetical protein
MLVLGRGAIVSAFEFVIGCFLVSFIANLGHWNGRAGERLMYYPETGLLRMLYSLWIAAAAIGTVLWLLRVVTLDFAGTLGLIWIGFVQGYSFWFRWRKRHAVTNGAAR